MLNIIICLIYKIKQEVFAMLLKEEINKYLNYCKFQKELDDKTIKAYKADLEQFITVIGENNPDKEMLNAYLVYLHRMYKQKNSQEKNCQREGTVSLFRGRRTDRDKSIP